MGAVPDDAGAIAAGIDDDDGAGKDGATAGGGDEQATSRAHRALRATVKRITSST